MSADNTSREALGEVMSENARTVIARAREEAEGRWPPSDGWQDVRRIWTDGATFAATITPEQVEAAAREAFWTDDVGGHHKQGRQPHTWGNIPETGRENYRTLVRAAFIAAGFQVGTDTIEDRQRWIKEAPDE